MSISPREYLRHILDEARYLSEESPHFTKAEFLAHETAKRAFVRLIHDYFGVDYDIVWDVAINKAATLVREIEAILQDHAS
jgi:uncharacterized protein with HEPN domain